MNRRRTEFWHVASRHHERRHKRQMLVPESEDGRMARDMAHEGGLAVERPPRCTERERQIAADQPRQKRLHPGVLQERTHWLVASVLILSRPQGTAFWFRRKAPASVVEHAIGGLEKRLDAGSPSGQSGEKAGDKRCEC